MDRTVRHITSIIAWMQKRKGPDRSGPFTLQVTPYFFFLATFFAAAFFFGAAFFVAFLAAFFAMV